MVSSSRTESLAQRFGAYIEELHDFFRSRHVPFGTKHDLETFPVQLQDASFKEEMVSMVRSIVYREDEAIPRTELADLIAVALAGPDLDDTAATPTLSRPLLGFVTEVVRSQRFTAPTEPTAEDEITPPVAAVPSPEPPVVLPIVASEPLTPVAAIPLAPQAAIAKATEDAATPTSTNDRLSRALFEFGAREEQEELADRSAREPAKAEFSKPRTPGPAQPAYTVPYAAKPRSAAGFFRNAYWLPGVCALLLVLGAAFFLRRPHAAATPPPAAAQPPYAAVAPPAKPSAYGPLLKGGRSHQQLAPPTETASVPLVPPAAPASGTDIPSEPHSSPRRSADEFATTGPRHMAPLSGLASSRVTPRVLGGREGVFLASSGAMAAHLLAAPAPHYPKLASLTHVEGEVIVQVVVGRDGGVEATRSLEGPLLLRSAAEHAIRHWRYRPYVVDGKPTDVATIVTVNFRLTH